jgi:hypothetical protein
MGDKKGFKNIDYFGVVNKTRKHLFLNWLVKMRYQVVLDLCKLQNSFYSGKINSLIKTNSNLTDFIQLTWNTQLNRAVLIDDVLISAVLINERQIMRR